MCTMARQQSDIFSCIRIKNLKMFKIKQNVKFGYLSNMHNEMLYCFHWFSTFSRFSTYFYLAFMACPAGMARPVSKGE